MTDCQNFLQKSIMKGVFILFSVFSLVYCKREKVSDLYDLLNDPKLMLEIEKRLGILANNDNLFSDVEVGCYDTTGTLASGCTLHANDSTIIKTVESINLGAKFLKDFKNISCPTDCTSLCCDDLECDTAVYQDKGDRKCYLFHCGDSSACVFSQHADYWMSSVSKAAHNSHSYTPGGASHSHENELANLGSHDKGPDTTLSSSRVPTTTPTTTTTNQPVLGEYCSTYETECEDPNAMCSVKRCRCRVGYHEKDGICRKHCRDDEFECRMYGSEQCILNRYVCDGHSDCIDASDELSCPDKNKPDDKPAHDRPVDTENNNGKNAADKPGVTDNSTTTSIPTANEVPQSTQKPETMSPTDAYKPTVAVTKIADSKADSQASSDTDQGQEPAKSKPESGDQSDKVNSSIKSNKTDVTDDEAIVESKNGERFKILNADYVEVESFTDSSQGPIVALALGLAITMILLIFVGCRLRTVKRRLRKGRALHSNEADYLINGMYL